MKINKDELMKMLSAIKTEKEKAKVDYERHSGVVSFLEFILANGEFDEPEKEKEKE